MECQEYLDRAKGYWVGAGTAVTGSAVAVGVAAVLNNSFFGAPGAPAAMITAGALAAGAVALLKRSIDELDYFRQCGGVPRSCQGAFDNLTTNIAAIAVVMGIQASACLAAAGIAWIPWAGAAPMYVILAALIVQAGLIVSLAVYLAEFLACVKREETSSGRGKLRPGEKASDPWYLRLHPARGNEYAEAIGEAEVPGSRRSWGAAAVVTCAEFTAERWKIVAVADIIGASTAIAFEWRFDGNAVPASSVTVTSAGSTLTLEVPAKDQARIEVTAREGSFTRTDAADVELPARYPRCKLTLPKYKPHADKVLEVVDRELDLLINPVDRPEIGRPTFLQRIGTFVIEGLARVTPGRRSAAATGAADREPMVGHAH